MNSLLDEYEGPERRREERLIAVDRLKVQAGLVTQALLYPDQYTPYEREQLAAVMRALLRDVERGEIA